MPAQAIGSLPIAWDGYTITPAAAAIPSRGLPIFAAEVSISHPGSATAFAPNYAWGGAPWGALSLLSQPSLLTSATILASDVGYRSRFAENGGFSRASTATYFDGTATLQIAPVDTARSGYSAWRTNYIRNNAMLGAVVGTPGTLPTNWSWVSSAGLSTQVVGIGLDAATGLRYVDVRLFGTTSGSFPRIAFDTSTGVPALQGQQLACSVYVQLVGGSTANLSGALLDALETTSGGAPIANNAASVALPTSTMTRLTTVRTMAQATVAFAWLDYQLTTSVGVAVDITVRIMGPQIEYASTVSDPITTSGAATTVPVGSAVAILETASSNYIRNPRALNAVAGSPGTLPTNWGMAWSDLTRTIVGSGTENGLPYLDVRFAGTMGSASNPYLDIETWTQIPAVIGETFTSSGYVSLVGGALPFVVGTSAPAVLVQFFEGNSTPTQVGFGQFAPAVPVLGRLAGQRFSATYTTTNAACVSLLTRYLIVANATGVTCDFTVRIAGFQVEKQAAASSLILPPIATVAASSRAADIGIVQPYPPLLTQAFQVNRAVSLDLASAGASAAWGSIILANTDGRFDTYPTTWNAERRALSILYGLKTLDTTRGYFTDPPYASLKALLRGMAGTWFLGANGLEIPIRDASYWLDAPLQTTLYQGTGTYEGPATLAGVPKPKARGGTASLPICNIAPVLIDAVNLIYQYNDGPGTIASLYEGAAKTITFASDTANLYVGTTPAGQYRTDNSRGLFQLGSVPASGYAITCDVTGAFPLAGAKTSLLDIVRYLLTEDLGLSSGYLDLGAFLDLNATYSYTAGWWWGPQATTASVEIPKLLSSIGAKLLPRRDGTLRPVVLRALGVNPVAVDVLDTTNIVSLTPKPLPASVSPPPYRVRAGYSHNFTVQSTGINTASSTSGQRAFVGTSDRFATWLSTAIQAAYPKPNDPDPIITALGSQADAQAVANDLGVLWGTGAPHLYDVVVPIAIALALDLGDVVRIRFPFGDLRSGRYGQIVGEQFTSTDATATFSVLV